MKLSCRLGPYKKSNNYSQPRNSPYTGRGKLGHWNVAINVPFIVTALIQTITFYTFATIHRGKFLSTCPPREVNNKLRGGRARFSCATLRMNIRSDHHAVVKRAPRLSADSLFFVSEARVSCKRIEDRIFRHLKRFQKSWIKLILLLFHIFPLWF